MTFELARIPDELILKLVSPSSQVWLKLALAVPFVGRFSLDARALARIQRKTQLPLIECWHQQRGDNSNKTVLVCRCRQDPCMFISKELAAFFRVDRRSKLQKTMITRVIREYAKANGLLSCEKDAGIAIPGGRIVYGYWETIHLDASLKRLMFAPENEQIYQTDDGEDAGDDNTVRAHQVTNFLRTQQHISVSKSKFVRVAPAGSTLEN
jgi:hypothetical protein